jgi:hypothetical protein
MDEGDALLLATGELVREFAGVIPHASDLRKLANPLRALFPSHFVQAVSHVFADGHVREQGTILKDDPHGSLFGSHPGGVVGDDPAVHPHGAGIGHFQAGDDPRQGGLPAAAGAHERKHFTLSDSQRGALQQGTDHTRFRTPS